MRIAVLGPGGVGGFVAAALDTQADITLVARRESAAVIAADGVQVHSTLLGRFEAHPTVTEQLGDNDAFDCLLVATKAIGLQRGLQRVAPAAPALVLPLLNGVEHMATLRAHFGDERVLAAVIRIESDRPHVGVIEQTSPGVRVDIAGPPSPGVKDTVASLAKAMRGARFDVRLGAPEPEVLWRKLARLCPLALTTTASDRPLGFVRDDPRWRSALENAVVETVAVAVAEGAEQLRAADTLAELEAAHPQLGSSMQRDIRAGRETELDAIAGAVLRAGARHELRCPTVQWLAERVALRAGA